MKKIIGVALFFLVAASPALAGGNSGGGSSSSGGGGSSGGMRESGGGSRTESFPGFGAQPAPRSFAPQTREAPMKFAAEPDRRRIQPRWFSNDYVSTQRTCPKNPFQEPGPAVNGCAVNPSVLYAFPSDDY